ncbi:unnamed protein product [Linum trigynum]|uniref:Uncharacterized protein n=1 Tax=Linum trigynum TaxID=586398 RepID=A0AAV2CEU4_9ROSI
MLNAPPSLHISSATSPPAGATPSHLGVSGHAQKEGVTKLLPQVIVSSLPSLGVASIVAMTNCGAAIGHEEAICLHASMLYEWKKKKKLEAALAAGKPIVDFVSVDSEPLRMHRRESMIPTSSCLERRLDVRVGN